MRCILSSIIYDRHDLVDLDVPLLLGLKSLEPLIIVQALLLGDSLEHVLDTRHHTLETTVK